MNNITFSYNSVNALISENALIDTFRFRVIPFTYSPKEFDSFESNNTAVLIHNHKPHLLNSFRAFNDIQVSIAKYLYGGNNFCFDFNDYRMREYQKHHAAIFKNLESDIKTNAGIAFDIFAAPCSRLHLALNVQCESFQNAARLRDYFYETVNLRYLPNKWKDKNTCYWNCPSYIPDDDDKRKKLTRLNGSLVQSNQTLALYPTGNSKLRFEYRRNNAASVQRLIASGFGASLKLENNFRSLSQPEAMNAIFWHTVRHFFDAEIQRLIVKSFSLRNEKKSLARFPLIVNV